MDIGNHFKLARIELGLSQKEVCEQANISEGHYSNLERNIKTPSLGTLLRISKILNINPNIYEEYCFNQQILKDSFDIKELDGLSGCEYKIIYETVLTMAKEFHKIKKEEQL